MQRNGQKLGSSTVTFEIIRDDTWGQFKVILEEFQSLEKIIHNEQISHGWTDDFYHVGSLWEYRFISKGRLIAGAIAAQPGRQTCFFTALDSLSTSMLTFFVHDGKPRVLSLTYWVWEERTMQFSWFDSKLAQEKLLASWPIRYWRAGRYISERVINILGHQQGVDRYVEKLSTECTQSMHAEISAHYSGNPAANTAPWAQSSAASHSNVDDGQIPIKQRKWQHLPCENKELSQCLPISQRMVDF